MLRVPRKPKFLTNGKTILNTKIQSGPSEKKTKLLTLSVGGTVEKTLFLLWWFSVMRSEENNSLEKETKSQKQLRFLAGNVDPW